ncbi:hypothetical protein H671_3g10189 [Cricetulus griseus]|uniref:Uncharacterized protein n=1 Tax=Cricetulus griseus TaxID=10029 RepID=A0A061IBS9_CRIGR|nr:hypothetical protein H671_3g10189 [Cricetulus griseus]
MDINADPSCDRATDPDMVLSSSLGPVVTMALDGSVGTQIGISPAAELLSDTNMAPGDGPDPRHPHGLQWVWKLRGEPEPQKAGGMSLMDPVNTPCTPNKEEQKEGGGKFKNNQL